MHARIQTWLPFGIQVCINGREWLARTMDRASLGYRRRENCFARLADVKSAQRLMDRQLELAWPAALDRIARAVNPAHERMFKGFVADYYWSVYQSEWATDVMFRDSSALGAIYPALVPHGMTAFSSPDVMRFLKRQLSAVSAQLSANFMRTFHGLTADS